MVELKSIGVQKRPVDEEFTTEVSCILTVDQNRMAHLCQMDPDLMGSPSIWFHQEKGCLSPLSNFFPVGNGSQPFPARSPDRLPLKRTLLS